MTDTELLDFIHKRFGALTYEGLEGDSITKDIWCLDLGVLIKGGDVENPQVLRYYGSTPREAITRAATNNLLTQHNKEK